MHVEGGEQRKPRGVKSSNRGRRGGGGGRGGGGRGGRGGRGGGGRGGRAGRGPPPSGEELDDELDSYFGVKKDKKLASLDDELAAYTTGAAGEAAAPADKPAAGKGKKGKTPAASAADLDAELEAYKTSSLR